MDDIQKGDWILVTGPGLTHIAQVESVTKAGLIRVRKWLSDKHRLSHGASTYHRKWLKVL